MDHFELFQSLAVALGIGLLVGMERGWVGRNEPEGERTLGLRTLGLTGLLGGVAGAIAQVEPQSGGPLLAAAFMVYALIIAVLRYREMRRDDTLGATTVVAALLVFALGAFAVLVDRELAATAGVAATLLLAFKSVLHGWLQRISWLELRAGLVLLVMSVVLLPVLPDRGFGPYKALNPHELWLMTVLIAAVSSIGYIAIRVAGDRWGVLLSAVAGGLVSSTVVTLTLARLSAEHPEREPLLRAGILLANATMMVRILIMASLFNAGLVRFLVIPLLAATLVLVGWAALLNSRNVASQEDQGLSLGSPFELPTVLKFGLLLSAVMLASKVLSEVAGPSGAYAVALASGLADVDAITLSMARLAGRSLSLSDAAGAILLAAMVNSLNKAALAAIESGSGPARRLVLPLGAAIAAGGAGLVLTLIADPLPTLR